MKVKTRIYPLSIPLIILVFQLSIGCNDEPEPAVITSFEPTSGYPGTVVTIKGSGFDAETLVKFNYRPAEVVSFSATQIIVKAPEGAVDGDITIDSRGARISAGRFDYKVYPEIQIDQPTYVTDQEVTLKADIIDLDSGQIDDHGFIYALSETTSVSEGTKISMGILDNPSPVSFFLDSLARTTKYFVRGYVSVNDTTFLSEQITFTTRGTNEWIKVSNGLGYKYEFETGLNFERSANYPVLNGKIYLIGKYGLRDGKKVLPFYEYDPTKNTLTNLPDPPGGFRRHPTRFVTADKIFIGMGSFLTSPESANHLYSFNTNTKEWSRVSDFGGAPMGAAVSVEFGNRVFIGFDVDLIGDQQTIWEYNATFDAWIERSSPFLPDELLHQVLMAVAINDKAYFLFKVTRGMRVWEYEPSTDKWTRKADFGRSFESFHEQSVIPFLSWSAAGKGYLSDVERNIWEYNPVLDQWKTIPDPPNKSSYEFGVAINNKILLGSTSEVYMYVPE